MHNSEFQVRTYTKKELGQMYFPHSTHQAAVNHLMKWICRCTPLLNQLYEIGYDKRSKDFTPRQIKLIVEFLGEP